MKLLLVLALLLLPQLAVARVYMCVDPQTGRTSFTDKGCPVAVAVEEVRVAPTNMVSGSRSGGGSDQRKVWRSDRDTRKSGREYNEQEREAGLDRATASID